LKIESGDLRQLAPLRKTAKELREKDYQKYLKALR
jgi:hypothetical protein